MEGNFPAFTFLRRRQNSTPFILACAICIDFADCFESSKQSVFISPARKKLTPLAILPAAYIGGKSQFVPYDSIFTQYICYQS
jgi:hypothetical protein